VKRTGKEWDEIINIPKGFTLIWPDGWKEGEYETKRISRREFIQRNVKCRFLPNGMEKEDAVAFLRLR